MHEFLRTACIGEVLAASGNSRESTLGLFISRLRVELWSYEAPDFAGVSVRSPEPTEPAGPVREAMSDWQRLADSGNQAAARSLAKIESLRRDLVRDGRFQVPPILNDEVAAPSLHDGRHRLVAAHSAWASGQFNLPLEVLWVRP
jgi:hypothetical protein